MTYATIHTLKFIALFTVILITLFFVTAFKANAYFTTAQKEVDLGNGTGLFLIEYKFGMDKHEVHMPLFTQLSPEKNNSFVSYEILTEDGEAAKGKSAGIVLSNAKLTTTGSYVTQKGYGNTFTLAVFFTPETKNVDEYRLQVTHLPFNFNGTQQLQLNPSELKYYTTKTLEL